MESQRLKEKGQWCCEPLLRAGGVPWVLKDMACSRLELGGEATFQNLPVLSRWPLGLREPPSSRFVLILWLTENLNSQALLDSVYLYLCLSLQNCPFQLDPAKPDWDNFTHGFASLKLAALHTVPVPHPLAFPARPGKPNPGGLCCEGNRAELLQDLCWPASFQP